MPIYEYQCSNCGHQLEALQKLSDAPLTDCPQCGEPSLSKQVSAAGFRLKGGGWYETDFKSGKKKNVAADAGGSTSSSSSSGDASSTSKSSSDS
ncbi:MAG: zinc ribbon domain-containing protein [Pseudomonadaceae bacterium]|nr:zinc ribbon domain-containing protein [Pseudomonadaceae bacterium]